MKRSSFITWDQLKVGVLVLVALIILAFAIVKLGQAGNLFGKRYRLVSYVSNASGLRVGGPVTVAGQLAGSIKEIKFLPPDADTSRNLQLVIEINQSIRDQVRQDSRAKINAMGLLGDKVYDVSVGTPRYRRDSSRYRGRHCSGSRSPPKEYGRRSPSVRRTAPSIAVSYTSPDVNTKGASCADIFPSSVLWECCRQRPRDLVMTARALSPWITTCG